MEVSSVQLLVDLKYSLEGSPVYGQYRGVWTKIEDIPSSCVENVT